MTKPDLIDPMVLFGWDPHEGSCCNCCAGGGDCGRVGMRDRVTDPLIYLDHPDAGGVVSDRHIMVRADMLAPVPEDTIWLSPTTKPATLPEHVVLPPPPEVLPEAVISTMTVARLDALDRAGLTRRGRSNASLRSEHGPPSSPFSWLYRGDEGVGWVSQPHGETIAGGPRWSAEDLPLLRRIAEGAECSLDQATTALHLARGGETA